MKELPLPARWMLVAIYLLGMAAVFLIMTRVPVPAGGGTVPELCLFIVLAAAAGHRKVTLLRIGDSNLDKNHGSMSLGFAMIFATMLRFGPQGALLAGFASTVASCLHPRQPWYQFLFNIAVNLIDTAIASLVFLTLNGNTLDLRDWHAFPAVSAACLSFFFVNTIIVATIIGICTGRSPIPIWRESFLWTAPSYFLGAGISTVASVVIGNKLLATLLCAVPIALLTHASFRSYLKHAADLID
ncbi:MAG: hypothetical protein SFU56_14725, partial [Capsulimonadales bacterium]|nr:hypothetical protein [Capsulimonadales bacterium]